jgi:hypothetical protein
MDEVRTAASLGAAVFAGLVSIICAIQREPGCSGLMAALSGLNAAMFVLNSTAS